jgi:multisubunit Na+/H+ antiporter MnhE subunit
MLHAAAMLAGFFALCLLFTGRASAAEDFALALAVALASVAAATMLGGVRKNPFSSAPQFLILITSRLGPQISGALATIRAALAADVTLQPALVSMRTNTASAFAKAAMIDMASAAPGAVVVESDADGVLVHVTDEAATGEKDLAALERRMAALLGARR